MTPDKDCLNRRHAMMWSLAILCASVGMMVFCAAAQYYSYLAQAELIAEGLAPHTNLTKAEIWRHLDTIMPVADGRFRMVVINSIPLLIVSVLAAMRFYFEARKRKKPVIDQYNP